MDKYKTAKKHALDANRLRSSWGKPYMLIGDLYAKTSRTCGENTGDTQKDEFTNRVGNWAAMEKYKHAKKVSLHIFRIQILIKSNKINIHCI